MDKTYVEKRDGGYWIKGTRISLDSIVYAFQYGAAPETIWRSFPLLSLEEVYGALTFYLAHEEEIDAYLRESDAQLEAQADARRARVRATKYLLECGRYIELNPPRAGIVGSPRAIPSVQFWCQGQPIGRPITRSRPLLLGGSSKGRVVTRRLCEEMSDRQS